MLLVLSYIYIFLSFLKIAPKAGLQFITMLVNSHWLQIILHHGEFLQFYFVISVHFCLSCTAYFENFISVCRICSVPKCIHVLCVSRRSVVVPVKKTSPGSMAVNTVGNSSTSAGLTAGSSPNIFAAAAANPKSMINTTGRSNARLAHTCTAEALHPALELGCFFF